MAAITWLHLSDLHVNTSRLEYDREHVMEDLLADLRGLASKHPRPDLIFFTGDLVFGHLPEEPIDGQFDIGLHFLDLIRSVWTPEVPKDRVFIVPGNHDVRRDLVTEAIAHYLDVSKQSKLLAGVMKRQDLLWDQVIDRLVPYREALMRHGYAHLVQHPKLLTFGHNLSIGDWNVQICGLNTAWSCWRDQEKGKLWFCGRWQISAVTKGPRPHFSIGIMHHPPGWFREEEDIPGLERLLESSFTFLLHGHEHDEWVATPSPSHTRIAAGACYGGEDNNNGYNLTSFDPTTGESTVRLRRYDTKGRKWIQNIVGGKTDDQGSWRVTSPDKTQVLKRGLPISTALATAVNKRWDAFLAVPMAALSSAEYKEQKMALSKVVKTLRRDWGVKIYYPAEHIGGHDKWDPADMAMIRGFKAAEVSRLFIMIYNIDRPSSILVEAGFALAHNIPSIYFVRKGLTLPFLLNAAGRSVSDVKIYEYSRYAEIVAILKKYKEELFEFMRPAEEHSRRGV